MEYSGQEMPSIVMYSAYSTYFGLLCVEERGALITAIFDYAFSGKERSELSPAAQMAFMFIKDQIVRDREKYAKTCEQRKKYGAMGGRPPKDKQEAQKKKEEKEEKDGSFDTDDFFEAAVRKAMRDR